MSAWTCGFFTVETIHVAEPQCATLWIRDAGGHIYAWPVPIDLTRDCMLGLGHPPPRLRGLFRSLPRDVRAAILRALIEYAWHEVKRQAQAHPDFALRTMEAELDG